MEYNIIFSSINQCLLVLMSVSDAKDLYGSRRPLIVVELGYKERELNQSASNDHPFLTIYGLMEKPKDSDRGSLNAVLLREQP